MEQQTDRWVGRPVLARVLQGVALAGPLAMAVAAAALVSRWLPAAGSWLEAAGWWLVLCAVSTLVLLAVDRYFRRLLPLVALLKLSLLFPHAAPSRYRIARSVASTRQMEIEVEQARATGVVGDREQAAEQVLRLVAALSLHDRATRGHAERVRVFADMIAEELELDEEATSRLRWAALLHDIGKITVDPRILNKPGRPTPAEWEVLRSHPLEGARLVAPLRGWLGEWGLAVEQHHERWDGRGYPYGLSGGQISLSARIVSVADAFDVMTASRSYKRPMPASAAREDLTRCAGSQFDPQVVHAFLRVGLGRLRWAVGPIAWLMNVPLVRLLPLPTVAPASASTGLTGMTAVASTAVATSGALGLGLPLGSLADVADASRQEAANIQPAWADEERGSAADEVVGPDQDVEPSEEATSSDRNGPRDRADAPGQSGEAPGRSGEAPGRSGEAPGRSGGAPGRSGEAPGRSGEAPGRSGDAPGKPAQPPGGGGKPDAAPDRAPTPEGRERAPGKPDSSRRGPETSNASRDDGSKPERSATQGGPEARSGDADDRSKKPENGPGAR